MFKTCFIKYPPDRNSKISNFYELSIVYVYQTSPLWVRMWQMVNFLAEFSKFEFIFSFRLVVIKRVKRTVCPSILPIAGGKIVECISFPKLFVLCETQIASSRIWTCVAVSISHDHNNYILKKKCMHLPKPFATITFINWSKADLNSVFFLVVLPRLKNPICPNIYLYLGDEKDPFFSKCISADWNANSPDQVLNWGFTLYFLRR